MNTTLDYGGMDAMGSWYQSDTYIKSLYDAKKLELPDGKKWHYKATSRLGKVLFTVNTTSEEHLERTLTYWYTTMKAKQLLVTSEWR